MSYRYHHLVLGGTFDFLHSGHKTMINKAFEIGKFVTIGITNDSFNKKRSKAAFQKQTERKKNLTAYLKKSFPKRYRVVMISDTFGTTLKDPVLEAIVVTKAHTNIIKLINQKRLKNSLKPLRTILVPYLKDEEGKIISSTRIREGQINLSGRSYKKLLLKTAGKKLSNHIRTQLEKPLGPILPSFPNHLASRSEPNSPYITIGDTTTANFLKAGLTPYLAVIDGKVGRQKLFMDPRLRGDDSVKKVNNPPGQISKSLILAIDQAFKKLYPIPYTLYPILVDGEEDLAAIPAILLSPLGTTVYYGQPNKGLVEVKVDLEIKKKLYNFLEIINN